MPPVPEVEEDLKSKEPFLSNTNLLLGIGIILISVLVVVDLVIISGQNSEVLNKQDNLATTLDGVRNDLNTLSANQGQIFSQVVVGNAFAGCVVDENSSQQYQLPVEGSLFQNRVRFIMDCPFNTGGS